VENERGRSACLDWLTHLDFVPFYRSHAKSQVAAAFGVVAHVLRRDRLRGLAADLDDLPAPPATAETPLLRARMVNEYVYCPRLAFLEWIEGEGGAVTPAVTSAWACSRR
jgi:hypothetical protein